MNKNIYKKLIAIVVISVLFFSVQKNLVLAATHTHTFQKGEYIYTYTCKEKKGSPACTASSTAAKNNFYRNPEVYATSKTQLGNPKPTRPSDNKVENNTSNNKTPQYKTLNKPPHEHEKIYDGVTYVYKCTETKGSPACTARVTQFYSNPEKYGVPKAIYQSTGTTDNTNKDKSEDSKNDNNKSENSKNDSSNTSASSTNPHYHEYNNYTFKCNTEKGSQACTAASSMFYKNPSLYGSQSSTNPHYHEYNNYRFKCSTEKGSQACTAASSKFYTNPSQYGTQLSTNPHYHEYNNYTFKCSTEKGSQACTAASSKFYADASKYGTKKENVSTDKDYGNIYTTEKATNNIKITEKNIKLTENQMNQYIQRLYKDVLKKEDNIIEDVKSWIQKWKDGMSVQEVTKNIILSSEAKVINAEIQDDKVFCRKAFEWIIGFQCGSTTEEMLIKYCESSKSREDVIKIICNSVEFMEQFTTEDLQTTETSDIKGSINFMASKDKMKKIGDLNGDGNIGIEDATILLAYVAQSNAGYDLSEYEYARDFLDINGDGKVRVNDVEFVLVYYANSAAMLLDQNKCDIRDFAKQKMQEAQEEVE